MLGPARTVQSARYYNSRPRDWREEKRRGENPEKEKLYFADFCGAWSKPSLLSSSPPSFLSSLNFPSFSPPLLPSNVPLPFPAPNSHSRLDSAREKHAAHNFDGLALIFLIVSSFRCLVHSQINWPRPCHLPFRFYFFSHGVRMIMDFWNATITFRLFTREFGGLFRLHYPEYNVGRILIEASNIFAPDWELLFAVYGAFRVSVRFTFCYFITWHNHMICSIYRVVFIFSVFLVIQLVYLV